MQCFKNKWILSIAISPLFSNSLGATSNGLSPHFSLSKSCVIHDMEGAFPPHVLLPKAPPAKRSSVIHFPWSDQATTLLNESYDYSLELLGNLQSIIASRLADNATEEASDDFHQPCFDEIVQGRDAAMLCGNDGSSDDTVRYDSNAIDSGLIDSDGDYPVRSTQRIHSGCFDYDLGCGDEGMEPDASGLLCGEASLRHNNVQAESTWSECCPFTQPIIYSCYPVEMPELGSPPSPAFAADGSPLEAELYSSSLRAFPESVLPRGLALRTLLQEEYRPYDFRIGQKDWCQTSHSMKIPMVMSEPGMMVQPPISEVESIPMDRVIAISNSLMNCFPMGMNRNIESSVGAAVATMNAEGLRMTRTGIGSLFSYPTNRGDSKKSSHFVSTTNGAISFFSSCKAKVVRSISMMLKSLSIEMSDLADQLEEWSDAPTTNFAEANDECKIR